MSLRRVLRKIPGIRQAYVALWRAEGCVRRRLVGPTRHELYDIKTCKVLEKVLSRDSACIDLGANTGAILKLMLRFAPAGKHHAVEALPDLAKRLAKRYPSVSVHSCAVADTTGDHPFNYVVDLPAYSGLRERSYPRNDLDIRVITVPVRQLDDIVPSDLVVRVVKADIEGGEYQAFCGARKLLRRSKPFIIFEFGKGGAGWYGISPEMMYGLLHDEFGLHISTMRRWLNGEPPLRADEFADSFHNDITVYFLAYPEPAA